MRLNQFRTVVLLCVCMAGGAARRADAQIYTWRDASGTLVVSDRPAGGELRSYEVPHSRSIRTTTRVNEARATAFDEVIEQHAATQGVRADLVRAVIQAESAFNPRARSPKGAMGLMQLMPSTARELGIADAYDPGENIRGGVTYLRTLLTRYDENEELALAAYNAGPGAVERYGYQIPPYRETRSYVAKIRSAADGAARAPAFSPVTRIYKSVDTVNGRAVARYSNVNSSGVAIAARPTPGNASLTSPTIPTPSTDSASLEETLQTLHAPRARR